MSLHETAQNLRVQAKKLMDEAARLNQAADFLDGSGSSTSIPTDITLRPILKNPFSYEELLKNIEPPFHRLSIAEAVAKVLNEMGPLTRSGIYNRLVMMGYPIASPESLGSTLSRESDRFVSDDGVWKLKSKAERTSR